MPLFCYTTYSFCYDPLFFCCYTEFSKHSEQVFLPPGFVRNYPSELVAEKETRDRD